MKDTSKLIKALEILAQDVESGDGVANAVIAEAATTISELVAQVESLRESASEAANTLGFLSNHLSGRMGESALMDMAEKADALNDALAATPQQCLSEIRAEAIESVIIDAYDAGCLNDFGGGNVGWWQDYIRSELDAAHDFYKSQVEQYAEKIRQGGAQ